jgi:hypothetical protein
MKLNTKETTLEIDGITYTHIPIKYSEDKPYWKHCQECAFFHHDRYCDSRLVKCNGANRIDKVNGIWQEIVIVKKEVLDNRSDDEKLVCSMLLG